MNEKEILAAIRLIRTSKIGPVTYSLLIARYGSARKALAALPEITQRQGRKITVAPQDAADAIFEGASNAGAEILLKGMPPYPERLAQFDDAPPLLFAKGHASLLNRPTLAIVGARNASINAMNVTSKWAKEIGAAEFIIISGLARGIDRAAHIGSLATGTIGVIGCGIDIIYPQENKDIFHHMYQGGLVLTELIPATKPASRSFPARNRIIASIARAVLVIEAAENSGSLITAREMAERGGEVMALPGSAFDKRAAGCNRLLKDGAHLVTSPDDVIDILASPLGEPGYSPLHAPPKNLQDMDDELVAKCAAEIMKNITIDPVDIDELARWCHVSAQMVQVALLELEISGHIIRLSGNRVCQSIETI